MVIFWKGKFLSDVAAPFLNVNESLLRGLGLFETMRAYQKNIIYFRQHIARIKNSAKILEWEFPYDSGKIQKIILRLLAINSLQDASVRLTLWKTASAAEILLTVKKYTSPTLAKYRTGFMLDIARLRQCDNSFLAQHKTTSRFIYEVSFNEARKKGFDEAIMLNQRGYISEGTRSNIFFIKGKAIFTPALNCGCLDGITRSVVCDIAARYGIKLYEGKFTLEDLCAADETFLTNSLIGLMPVSCIGKKYFHQNRTAKITRFLIREYSNLLRRKR